MIHRWDTITFIHWQYSAHEVQRLLPEGLVVETFDGAAWVGLVPFYLRVRVPGVPYLPWVSQFPETNVRTYVRATDGSSGVWFFSLDAARLGAVVLARSWYRLPYVWDRMRIGRDDDRITYESQRRWPGPRGARASTQVRIGHPFAAHELSELDHFLTARWNLYSDPRKGLSRAKASHEMWGLHHAHLVGLEDELVQAAGLTAPTTQPLVHYSPGVEVRIGWPHTVRSQ